MQQASSFEENITAQDFQNHVNETINTKQCIW